MSSRKGTWNLWFAGDASGDRINIIAQGSSASNISFLVQKADMPRAVTAIDDHPGLGSSNEWRT